MTPVINGPVSPSMVACIKLFAGFAEEEGMRAYADCGRFRAGGSIGVPKVRRVLGCGLADAGRARLRYLWS